MLKFENCCFWINCPFIRISVIFSSFLFDINKVIFFSSFCFWCCVNLSMPTKQYYLNHDMTKLTKWVCTQRRLRSAWDAQVDQSLRWAHIHFVGFVMSWLISYCYWVFLSILEGLKDQTSSACGITKFAKLTWAWKPLHEKRGSVNNPSILRTCPDPQGILVSNVFT